MLCTQTPPPLCAQARRPDVPKGARAAVGPGGEHELLHLPQVRPQRGNLWGRRRCNHCSRPGHGAARPGVCGCEDKPSLLCRSACHMQCVPAYNTLLLVSVKTALPRSREWRHAKLLSSLPLVLQLNSRQHRWPLPCCCICMHASSRPGVAACGVILCRCRCQLVCGCSRMRVCRLSCPNQVALQDRPTSA